MSLESKLDTIAVTLIVACMALCLTIAAYVTR